MNVLALQSRLAAARCPCAADGVMGPMTYAALLSYAAQRQLAPLGQALGVGMAAQLAAYGITSDLGLVHWTAQACHETEGFRSFHELGSAAYFARYDGRAELGNTQPGDGYRYRGRGVFQLTGRANYARVGAQLGLPLEAQPDLAAEPANAVRIACAFWLQRRIQPLADRDDVLAVTRAINGGLEGFADREAILQRLKRLVGLPQAPRV